MSINKDVIDIIKSVFPDREYEFNGCNVLLHFKYLDRLYKSISEYFNQYQK